MNNIFVDFLFIALLCALGCTIIFDRRIIPLFMVAFAIMVISARTGATGTHLSKIHAAHSLGVTSRQIIRRVILPIS